VRSHWLVVPNRVNASRGSRRRSVRTPNFYRILDLRPGADSVRVKEAYRRLVKRFHPDINAGEAGAEQRIKEINHAYQTLRHPETRAAYDLEMSRQRAETRWRFWKLVATGVASFIVTVSSVFLVALPILSPPQRETSAHKEIAEVASLASRDQSPKRLSPPLQSGPREELETELPERAKTVSVEEPVLSAPDQGKHSPSETHNLTLPKIRDGQNLPTSVLTTPALPRGKPANWVPYHNARFGFALRYPADVFASAARDDVQGNEHLLSSKDSRSLLWISATLNGAAKTVAEYRQSVIKGRYADATFDYTPQRSHWFVLSGTVGEEMFYERITFSCDSRTIHRWLVLYPHAERAYFDEIVEEINRSYRYDLSPRTRCAGPQSEPARARKASPQ
jgi:DnaJ-domain-containing protein 1